MFRLFILTVLIVLFDSSQLKSQTLLNHDVFNYEIGEQWVIRTDYNGPPLYRHFRVTNKTVFNADSIAYQFKTTFYHWKYSDFSYIKSDSIYELHFGKLNQPYFSAFLKSDTVVRIEINGNESQIYSLKDSVYFNECNLAINSREIKETPIISEHKYTIETAIAGIGVLKTVSFPRLQDNFSKEDLIYVKKGNDSCGNIKSLPTKVQFIIDVKSLIYPNPCNDFLKLDIEYDKLQFYNAQGEMVKSIEDFNHQVNMEDLMNGVYTIRLVRDKQIIYYKVLVLH